MKTLLPLFLLCATSLVGFTACKERPKSTGEKIEDKVKDGLNVRPHEKIKDAAEDVKDAIKN